MDAPSPPNAEIFRTLESAIFQSKRAFDSLREGVVITDPTLPDNPIVYVNDSFLELAGYERVDILGKNCRFLQGKDTDAQAIQELKNAIRAEKTISLELLNYTKNRTPFWNHLTISPVRNEQGTVVNFAAIQRDVTDLHNMRSQLENRENQIESLKKAIELLKDRVKEQEDAIASFIMYQPLKEP